LFKNLQDTVSIRSRLIRRLVEGVVNPTDGMVQMIELKPRYFVLPAIALTVLGMLYVPAVGGRASGCGPAVRIADPGIRASFDKAQRRQSKAASEICAIHANVR
jgi:hypothetical protein